MSTFKLTILTPFGAYFNGDVEFLEVRNEDSVLGILPHHTPIISTVKLGKIVVIIKGNRNIYACSGGVLNVKKDGTVSLLVNTIERKDEIDVERARKAKERALKHLQKDGYNKKRAMDALKRAENRIEISDEK